MTSAAHVGVFGPGGRLWCVPCWTRRPDTETTTRGVTADDPRAGRRCPGCRERLRIVGPRILRQVRVILDYDDYQWKDLKAIRNKTCWQESPIRLDFARFRGEDGEKSRVAIRIDQPDGHVSVALVDLSTFLETAEAIAMAEAASLGMEIAEEA